MTGNCGLASPNPTFSCGAAEDTCNSVSLAAKADTCKVQNVPLNLATAKLTRFGVFNTSHQNHSSLTCDCWVAKDTCNSLSLVAKAGTCQVHHISQSLQLQKCTVWCVWHESSPGLPLLSAEADACNSLNVVFKSNTCSVQCMCRCAIVSTLVDTAAMCSCNACCLFSTCCICSCSDCCWFCTRCMAPCTYKRSHVQNALVHKLMQTHTRTDRRTNLRTYLPTRKQQLTTHIQGRIGSPAGLLN